MAVGHGSLGTGGSLGYEGKSVRVRGRAYSHALSAHPPARLVFELAGRFRSFRCTVGLNDDVPSGSSHADFMVLADGRQVAEQRFVVAGEQPRPLSVNIPGARVLELATQSSRWVYSHAVWLDPQVSEASIEAGISEAVDCLGRAAIQRRHPAPKSRRCIATVVSRTYAALLDDMLGSLCANGRCPDARMVVFGFDADESCARVAAKYQATLIRCRPLSNVNAMSKAVLYSAPLAIDADYFVCLDADMLVLGGLDSVFDALDAVPEGSILAVREGNGRGWHQFQNLNHALTSVYGGRVSDWERLGGATNEERLYSLVVNDGLFAGTRPALLALDGVVRGMAGASAWIDERRDIWWRNQFIFNVALARLGCGVELDATYNVQLNSHEVAWQPASGRMEALWESRSARVLHFNGLGRNKYSEQRQRFARVPDPVAAAPEENFYQLFLDALRKWLGRNGTRVLAWSFYGTSNGSGAHVADSAAFPLLASLHYLIRSNGCMRVLETGTARGVSAACLASAVAHREGGRVVSFDPVKFPDRDELWDALPTPMRDCIEARPVDSLTGMQAALSSGEHYEAALLDSMHMEAHVWAEFQLAAQLVCPSGLILIHDALCSEGTVGPALERIANAGYNVVRLWAAERGVSEESGLGLAVIENRRRACSQIQSNLSNGKFSEPVRSESFAEPNSAP